MKIIKATIMFVVLEFIVGLVYYATFASGAYELIKENLIDNLPAGFTHTNIFTNMFIAVNFGFLLLMVGLIPGYILYALRKESVETQWREY